MSDTEVVVSQRIDRVRCDEDGCSWSDTGHSPGQLNDSIEEHAEETGHGVYVEDRVQYAEVRDVE